MGLRTLPTGRLATICLVFSALAAPALASAGTFHSGPVSYKSATSTVSSNSPSFGAVDCGSGRRMLAPGVDAGNATLSNLAFVDSDSDGDTDDASIATIDNTTASSTKLTVWAVCLSGSKASSLVYAHSNSSIPAGSYGLGGAVSCGANHTTGLGLRVSGALNESQLNTMGYGFSGRTPDQTNSSVNFQSQGAAKLYSIQAACLPASVGTLRYPFSTKVLFPSETKTIKAPCPKNTRVVGGGWQGFADPVTSSQPYDSSDHGKTPDNGWKITVHSAGFGGFAAEAICLPK